MNKEPRWTLVFKYIGEIFYISFSIAITITLMILTFAVVVIFSLVSNLYNLISNKTSKKNKDIVNYSDYVDYERK